MAKSVKSKKELRKIYKKRAYYFILAFVLVVCLLQFTVGSLYNVTRYIVLTGQLNNLKEINEKSVEKNKTLRNQLKVYSSTKGIEELARNNLKMVGQDEVLVLIKNNPVP